MRSRTHALALAALLAAPLPAQAASSPAPRPVVVGYYAAWAGSGSFAALLRYGRDLTAVAPYWFSVGPDGSLRVHGAYQASVVATAHRLGDRVVALVNNAGGQDQVLHDPAAARTSVASLAAAVRQDHLDGVNVDFEGLRPSDRLGLVAYVAQLKRALAPLGAEVSVAVGPRTAADGPQNDPQGWAYAYRALGHVADWVVLMTYDRHDGGSAPGPVAPLPWVEQVARFAATRIPARKLLLGIAAYGYDWSAAGGTTVTAAQAEALARQENAPPQVDPAADESHFAYVQGGLRHVVWFESGANARDRIRLAASLGLGGVAVWYLGAQDAALFPALAAWAAGS